MKSFLVEVLFFHCKFSYSGTNITFNTLYRSYPSIVERMEESCAYYLVNILQ